MRIGPFGVWEILIILIVVLLIFGPRRLPEMAKGLGQSVREFRKEMRNIKDDFNVDEPRDTPAPRSGVSPATVQEAQETRAPASAAPSAPAADTAGAAESPKVDDEKKG